MKITELLVTMNKGEITNEILSISYYIIWNRNINVKTWVNYGVNWGDGKIYRYSEDYCLICGNIIEESTNKKRLRGKKS